VAEDEEEREERATSERLCQGSMFLLKYDHCVASHAGKHGMKFNHERTCMGLMS